MVSGICSRAIFSRRAARPVLTFTTTGIFNLAYGAVAFTSAFLYFELQSGLHWASVWAGLIVVVVFAPLLGLVLDRFIFRKLVHASDASKIMAVVGVLIALPALTEWIVHLLISVGHFDIPDGSLVFLAPGLGPEPPAHWHFGSILSIDSDQLTVAIVAFVMAVVLWYILKRTTLGLKMRAQVDRPDLATARGVDRARTSGTAWVLGTVMAALAGVAAAPIFNSLTPNTYLYVLLASAAAAVLGGFRSVPLAALGGLLIGAVQSLVAGYATFAPSIPGFSDAVPFVFLFVGLGFWGAERRRPASQAVDDVPPPDYLSMRPSWRRIAPWIFWFVVLFAYILFAADAYWLGLATQGLALAIVFLSFTIVTGLGGIVSLAQAAFVTGAGLMAGVLISHYHEAYVVGLLGGVAFAVALGVIVTFPALRLGGLSLAFAALALGLGEANVMFQWSCRAGPLQQGWAVPQPTIGPFHLSDNKTMAVFLAIIVIIVIVLISNLQHSPSGRMMSAVRTSESAAETSGISGPMVKITLFAVSAALAGLGGILLVTVDQHVTNSTYTTETGLVWLATVVLWGIRRPSAALAAALSSTLLTGILSSGFHFSFISWSGTSSVWLPQVLFGLGAVTMAQNPDGILALTEEQSFRRKQKRELKRAAREVTARAPAALLHGDPNGSTSPAVALSPAAPPRGRVEHPVLRLSSICAAYGETKVLFDIDLDVRR